MKSILVIVDKPGWSIDNQVNQVIAGDTQYSWTKVFHNVLHNTSANLASLAAAVDLVWCANHTAGPRFWREFKHIRHPRVLVTFRSWRYNEKAIPFVEEYAHTVSAVSMELTAHLRPLFPRVRYVPDSIPEFFKPSRQKRIGFVGVPDAYKGFALIQKAVKNCGFELLAAPRFTDPKLGFNRPQSDMPAFYEACDAIVVASEQEGAGTIALEAMAMNVPVLTTRVGSAADLDGLYIERTGEGIESGLRRLFGRSKVFPAFSVVEVNRQYAQLFEDILK